MRIELFNILNSLRDLIYPNKCMICRRVLTSLEDEYICTLCSHRLCGEINTGYNLGKGFANDLEWNEEWPEDMPRMIISLFPYESEYRKAILRWKYRGIRKYAKGFAKLLVEENHFEVLEQAVLIPIPLAPSRMKKRGFNQALDLAVELGKLTGITVVDGLKRIYDTKPQASCSREERFKNAKGSMNFSNKVSGKVKSVLLIDDIYTTGSTIKEAIRAIRNSKTFQDAFIYVVVVGKGDF